MAVFVCLMWILITYNAMIGSFVFMNPLFVCNGIDTTEPNACLDLRKCSITNDFTAVFRNELYCEK